LFTAGAGALPIVEVDIVGIVSVPLLPRFKVDLIVDRLPSAVALLMVKSVGKDAFVTVVSLKVIGIDVLDDAGEVTLKLLLLNVVAFERIIPELFKTDADCVLFHVVVGSVAALLIVIVFGKDGVVIVPLLSDVPALARFELPELVLFKFRAVAF
jgi:hypothetical protein